MIEINKINTNPKPAPVEEVRHIEEEVRLPMLSEITDKDGKVKLPPELVAKLRDPNARFRVDLVACPTWTEEWEVLQVSCMSEGCGNTTVSKWVHSNCPKDSPSSIQWSTHARLWCPTCGEVSDISKWSFECHGDGCTRKETNLITLTDVVGALLELPDANRQFAAKFLKSAKEIYKKK